MKKDLVLGHIEGKTYRILLVNAQGEYFVTHKKKEESYQETEVIVNRRGLRQDYSPYHALEVIQCPFHHAHYQLVILLVDE